MRGVSGMMNKGMKDRRGKGMLDESEWKDERAGEG